MVLESMGKVVGSRFVLIQISEDLVGLLKQLIKVVIGLLHPLLDRSSKLVEICVDLGWEERLETQEGGGTKDFTIAVVILIS